MNIFRLYEEGELGSDGYPPEWHEWIKHEVRQNAGDRCIRCSHPYSKGNGEWSPCDAECNHAGPFRCCREGDEWTLYHETTFGAAGASSMIAQGFAVHARWRILTVHHLDMNKANCRWWNLAALCQRCHLTIQGRVRMERVYPWPHSDWFKPYVAGFYAFSYLGEDLERSEVESRLDELLSLELAA